MSRQATRFVSEPERGLLIAARPASWRDVKLRAQAGFAQGECASMSRGRSRRVQRGDDVADHESEVLICSQSVRAIY